MISFACPACKSAINVPSAAAGKQGSCPKCGQRLQIPEAQLNRPVVAELLAGGNKPADAFPPPPRAGVGPDENRDAPLAGRNSGRPETKVDMEWGGKHQFHSGVVQITFGVEAGDDGNRVVVTLKNAGTQPVEVHDVVVCGPVDEGPNATVRKALAFRPEASHADVLLAGESCNFVTTPDMLTALKTLPTYWWVEAKGGGQVVAEVPARELLEAVRLCFWP
jgi:hypothetical protein